MKHFTKQAWTRLLLPAAFAGVVAQAGAETVSDYTVDFNTAINTSAHDFRVTPKWKHTVDVYNDDYGSSYYMTYTYKAADGVDGTGALFCGEQRGHDAYSYGQALYDLLITPVVSGQVKLDVKTYNNTSSACYVEAYTVQENGKNGTKLFEAGIGKNSNAYGLNDSEFKTIEFTVDTPQRIALRCSYVTIDNFIAESAEINPEGAMVIASAVPTATTGVLNIVSNQDGSGDFTYTVTVTNTGDIDLTPGMEDYSISIFNGTNQDVYCTVPVPETLAVGQTSGAFDVTAHFTQEQMKALWPNLYSQQKLYLRENMGGGVVERTTVKNVAYEPKFAFRAAGTSTTSSLSTTSPINWSAVESGVEKTYSFEIYNDGTAPLTVKSLTLPEGYSAEYPEGQFLVPSKGAQPLVVAISETPGHYNGNITAVYLDPSGNEKTYSMPITGHRLAEGEWSATFDSPNSTIIWPQGTVAEAGIQTASFSNTVSGYNFYLKTYTNTSYIDANNRFITPKLHAAAGDKLYFETAPQESTVAPTHGVKVYVSTDRVNWGEPVATYMGSEFSATGSNLQAKEITFDTEGDYYVAFADFAMKLDNIIGLTKAPGADHDLALREFTVPETAQNGEEFTVTAEFWNTTSVQASDYTVKVYVDGQEAEGVTIASKGIDANPKNYSAFTTKMTLNVESTCDKQIRIDLVFTDGTVITSGTKTINITYAPEFGFYKKGNHGTKWNHTSERNPIAYGKTNTPGLKQEFEVHNWGSAPLTVKSVEVPEGFATSFAEQTEVAAKECHFIDLSFTATEPGTYEGDMTVTYVDAEGEDATFTLPMTGTMLDPSKWYVSFDNGTTDGAWPAGSVHKSNVSLTNTGTYAAPNVAAYCTAGTGADRMFVSPKLHVAEGGGTLQFDSRIYSTGWKEGTMEVFYAASRDILLDADRSEEWIALGKFSGQNVEDDFLLTTDYRTCSVEVPEGDWYIGFQITSRAYLDEIYGPGVAPVEADLTLVSANVPATAMQNNPAAVTLNVLNLGTAPVAAEDYTVTVYVNGEAITAEGEVEIPVKYAMNESTAVTASFRYPKVGTFPIRAELAVGDYKVSTQEAEITITEEIASAEKTVGEFKEWSQNMFLYLNYQNSETVAIYTPDDLQLAPGEKISKISIRGYGTGADLEADVTLAYQWIDETTLSAPSSTGRYDTTGMTLLEDAVTRTWTKGGSASEPIDMIVFQFPEPIVYEAGKTLKLLVRSCSSTYKNGYSFEISKTTGHAYMHYNDVGKNTFTGSWSSKNAPVLHMEMVAQATSLSGVVTGRDETPVEGAVVTLVSTDGDNVQYSATTGSDGAYSLNVIQNTRDYDLLAVAEGREEFIAGVDLTADEDLDIVLRPVFHIHGEASHEGGDTEAVVYIDRTYPAGFHAVTLPVALDSDEMAELFGDEAIVLEYIADTLNGSIAGVRFETATSMEAGVPYLVYLKEGTEPVRYHSKDVAETLVTKQGDHTDFIPTTAPKAAEQGMFVISDENGFVRAYTPDEMRMRAAMANLPAYSAYIKVPDNVTSVDLVTNADVPTEVETLVGETEGEDTVYTIDGLRVKNPAKGIYIVNGKARLVK